MKFGAIAFLVRKGPLGVGGTYMVKRMSENYSKPLQQGENLLTMTSLELFERS